MEGVWQARPGRFRLEAAGYLAGDRVDEPEEHAVSEHSADYSKHTDEELREGVAKATEQEPRIAAEDSDEALEAAREQREAMSEELTRRNTTS
jgi:hypothetical protein